MQYIVLSLILLLLITSHIWEKDGANPVAPSFRMVGGSNDESLCLCRDSLTPAPSPKHSNSSESVSFSCSLESFWACLGCLPCLPQKACNYGIINLFIPFWCSCDNISLDIQTTFWMQVHSAVADLDIMTMSEYVLKTHQRIAHVKFWQSLLFWQSSAL